MIYERITFRRWCVLAKTKAKAKTKGTQGPARRTGRPTKSNRAAIQAAVCKLTSTTTWSLHTILTSLQKTVADVPHYDTIRTWIATDQPFSDKYAKAKLEQLELMSEEIIDIADDSSLDMAFTEEGKAYVDREHINRSRLRVDTRKWVLSKLLPKKYGDKLEVAGNAAEPLTIVIRKFTPDVDGGGNGA